MTEDFCLSRIVLSYSTTIDIYRLSASEAERRHRELCGVAPVRSSNCGGGPQIILKIWKITSITRHVPFWVLRFFWVFEGFWAVLRTFYPNNLCHKLWDVDLKFAHVVPTEVVLSRSYFGETAAEIGRVRRSLSLGCRNSTVGQLFGVPRHEQNAREEHMLTLCHTLCAKINVNLRIYQVS